MGRLAVPVDWQTRRFDLDDGTVEPRPPGLVLAIFLAFFKGVTQIGAQ
jgi:hypothetical protein